MDADIRRSIGWIECVESRFPAFQLFHFQMNFERAMMIGENPRASAFLGLMTLRCRISWHH